MTKIIRSVRAAPTAKNVYLTFDDGPDPDSTPKVLDFLAKVNIKATFFVVVNKARKNPHIIGRMLSEGHAIGNHSLDHSYNRLFLGKAQLKSWVSDSEKLLNDLIGRPNIGFRPPNGILVPPLLQALRELELPIILWNVRFYDSLVPWTKRRALKSCEKMQSGSIVLLHDRFRAERSAQFLETLAIYHGRLKETGFSLAELKLNLI